MQRYARKAGVIKVEIKNMKALFITRKYPPSIGGMQKLSYDVINNFPELKKTEIISWGGDQKGLIFFIPWAFLKSFYFLGLKKVDIIHFGDCALAFMGYIFKKIFRTPIVITAHGLDMTYQNRMYQFMVNLSLKTFDKVICVSTAAKDVVISKGVEPSKCIVIHNGTDTSEWRLTDHKNVLRKELERKTDLKLEDKFLLLSVGRLVKRKGVYWFIENVFPKLSKNVVFLIVGNGEEEPRIKELIRSLNLTDRIVILGRVQKDVLKLLYNSADIFIMPNIPVQGDMEGFGIVAIEAASCGLPVIASNLEGIKDAIKDGENGFLIEPYDSKGYIKKIDDFRKIKNLNHFKKKQIKYTQENYDSKKISFKYYSLFKTILGK